MEKPQRYFKDITDNTTNPFVPKIKHKPYGDFPLDLSKPYEHPYHKEILLSSPSVELMSPPQEFSIPKPQMTQLVYVSRVDQLLDLMHDIRDETELALDLEQHTERSFQGFTSLMQLSSSTVDYVIDTIALRDSIHLLCHYFTRPHTVIIVHGTDDTVWLQRDFGVYIQHIFNTQEGARILKLDLSLHGLVKHYFNVQLDKEYQTADWRIRPLSKEMLEYARSDTHYLREIYHRMKADLIAISHLNVNPQKYPTVNNYLNDAIVASNHSNLRVYKKKPVTENPLSDPNFKKGLNEYLNILLYFITALFSIFLESSFLVLLTFYIFLQNGRVMDKEMEYVVVAVFKWREQMARQYDESISFIMGKAVIFNIGYQKACTIEDIRRLYTPIPDCILERLEELRTVINNAIAEAKSVTSQSTFSTTVGSYVSNLSPSTFDPINYSNLVNFNKYNKYPPHVNFKRSLPAKPIFPFLQNMSALGVDPSFVYGTINNNTGNNNNNTGDNNNTNNGDNNSTQGNDNSNGNSNDNNENNINNSNNGLNDSFVDYSKLAKQAVGFLDRAYQDLPINPKTANYIFGSDKVKLELPRNVLSSLSPSLAVSVGSIEITSSNKTVAKQNILKILPLKTRTQSDLQEFWGEIATINYSLLVFFLKDGDFMEIPPMFKDSALRLELQQKSNIILLSYNPPISISSDSLPISSVTCIPSPSPAIPLYSPPVAESNTPFCCTEEQTGFNLVCNNLKEGAMCGAFLCESEHLFVKDHGIHSYNPLALQFVTTLIHPDKPQFPDKLYKIHCRSCTLSVGNIMICHEPEADYIFNFKKINVMFSNKKLPENMLQPHKWMYLSRRNSEKRELPSKRVCSPPRQREVPKPVAENKIVQLQFTAVDEWFVYRLSLSDLACEHTYTHLESRKFVGFLLLSSKELFTKPFVVSRPKVSHTVSLTLFEKLKPSESQSKKITELSDSYLNLIPNVDLNIYRKNNFQILPYFSFNESLPGFQDNLDFLHKVLQLQPALPLLHNCVSSVASRHQVYITLGTLGETPSEPQSAEDIARRDAKEEILRLFQHRLFVPPRGHKWLILNFAFQKNPLSGNFQNNTFVDYYKKKGHQITDLTQPILIAGESIDSSHEYVPELVMLSGVTAEMYQVGKLLIDVVGGLQKSSGELAHLSNLQNSLGYWINDVNLLKKVFTSKVAADTNRQKESSHYEEEEFLGDSVLEFVLSYYLFLKHENAAEGELTAMAIKFKKNKKLEEVANRLGFSEYIVTANRTAVVSSQVSDAMESFIGGLFLDSGLKVATDFILDKIIEDKTFDLFQKFELPQSYKFIVEPLNKIKKFKAMEEMEEKLNYKFTTKELLMQALTHKSAFQTSLKRKQPLPLTYDRLEFLGDAIFKFIAGVHCYMLKRNSCVGNIHDARQRLITGEAQNRMADKIGVRPALIIGQSFNIDNAEKNPTGDAVEALVAAIFLETGFDPLFKGHCCKINSDNKENQNNNNNNNNNNNQNNISQNNNNNNNCCSNGGTVVTILHDLFSYVDEDE